MNTKQLVIDEMLIDGRPVLIWVDGRGCDVPEQHRISSLVLRIGHGLTPPITELTIGHVQIVALLSFNGEGYRCVVPWSALYATAFDGDPESRVTWPGSAPRSGIEPPKPPPHRGHLRSIS